MSLRSRIHPPRSSHSTSTRDAALRRLSLSTRWLIAGSVALTGALSEAAAHAFPGKTVKVGASKQEASPSQQLLGRRELAGAAGDDAAGRPGNAHRTGPRKAGGTGARTLAGTGWRTCSGKSA